MAELRKITGYQLREAIKNWELRKNTAQKQFQESMWIFEGDTKASLEELADAYLKAEQAIARLQTLQAQYNLAVAVEVQDRAMTLCQAVKLIGGAGRLEKMWRDAATGSQQHYGYAQMMVRQKDQEFAKRAVNATDAVVRTTSAARFASALRNAIALGNTRELELEVPAELLE
jgi:hypothetical protein